MDERYQVPHHPHPGLLVQQAGAVLAQLGQRPADVVDAVGDVRGALQALREQGARLLDEEPRMGVMGHLVAFIHPKSAGGVLTELVQSGR